MSAWKRRSARKQSVEKENLLVEALDEVEHEAPVVLRAEVLLVELGRFAREAAHPVDALEHARAHLLALLRALASRCPLAARIFAHALHQRR